jgi:hypothetical protein
MVYKQSILVLLDLHLQCKLQTIHLSHQQQLADDALHVVTTVAYALPGTA